MFVIIAKRAAPIIISLATTGACLFGSAGRLDWPNGWVVIGLTLAGAVAATAVLIRNPELHAERRNFKAGKSWDKVIVPFVVLVGPAAMWITAGLDYRHHWSARVPNLAVAAAIGAALLGCALVVWAMRSNRFFSSVVRVQRERGHTVVTEGPYRHIRHPGYAGMSLFTLATPLILKSWWALFPAAINVTATLVRTVLEDRTLQNELEGYREYARSVTCRLVPFVW
jgi:protein-S-isoprenylcysteine O-methyltransferase Ste14